MKLELSKAVCRWLTQLGILQDAVQDESQGKASVSFDEQIYLENGWLVGRVLRHIERDYKLGLKHLGRIRKITVLKEHENWQIIWQLFGVRIDIRLPDEYEKLQVSENNSILAVVLQQIYVRFYQRPPKLKVPENRTSFTLESFQPEKELDDAVSTLELVCLAIGRAFELGIAEVLALLVDRQRGLAHLIVQGSTKTEFQQVLDLYQLLIDHSETFRELMQRDSQHTWVMNSLRCGLFSNSVQVAIKCIRLMKELSVSEWLRTTDNMKSLFLGLRRHPELSRSLFDVMVGTLNETFVPYLKNELQGRFTSEEQFMVVAAEMVKYIKYSLYKKEFLESMAIDDWLLLALECLDSSDKFGQAKMSALSLLTQAMMLHDFTRNLRFGSQIKNVFSAEVVQQLTLCSALHFCCCVARLLHYHAERKNPQARRYYELLCRIMQIANKEEVRDFVVMNLMQLFARFAKMPLQVFLASALELNLEQPHELHLLNLFARDSSLQPDVAVSVGELALTNYKKSLANFQFSEVVVQVAKRFRSKISEFIYSTVRDLLAVYKQLLEKPATASKRVESLAKRAQAKKMTSIFYTQGEENELIHEKKKANTLNFIRRLLEAANKPMAREIKPWVVGCKRQLDKKKLKHRGLQSCVDLLEGLLTAPDDELEFSEDPSQTDIQEEDLALSKFTVTNQPEQPQKRNPLLDSQGSDNQFLNPITPLDRSKLKFSKADSSQLPQARSSVVSEEDMQTPKQSTILSQGLFRSPRKPQEPLREFNDQQKEADAIQFITEDLLETHEIIYLKNTKDRYQKLFPVLLEQYNRMGLVQFVRHYNLIALLLSDSFSLIKNHLTVRNQGVFTLELFIEFLVNIAYNSFPMTGKLVEADCLERLIKYIEQQCRRRGESALLFEDIDQVFYSKSEKVRELTDQLRKEGAVQLPADYRMHVVTNASYANTLSTSKLRIKQSSAIAYQILSELFQQVTHNSSLIEPVLIIENKLTVRPNVFTALQQTSPTKQDRTKTVQTPEEKQPVRNKFRITLDASRIDPHQGRSETNNAKSPNASTLQGIGNSPKTSMVNTPVSLLQPSLKVSLVELNRKRVEKLALRRKILQKDTRNLSHQLSADLGSASGSPPKESVDMPTQITQSALQGDTDPPTY